MLRSTLLHCLIAALREVRLLVSGAQSAHGVRASVAMCRCDGASRNLADVLLAESVVFVLAIATAAAMIIEIKHVHAVVLIIEECAAAEDRTMQRRVRLRSQCDHGKSTDQLDRDRAAITGSGGVDSERD